MKTRNKNFWLVTLFVVPLLSTVIATGATSEPKPLFRQDLRSFGYVTEQSRQSVANYTDLNFLSENLVLVTINTRIFGPVEHLFSDEPPSKLFLFDTSRKSLLKSVEMRLEKGSGSVRATKEGQFVLLNESGLSLCSHELECASPLHTRGPIVVSPRGTRILAGGNGQTELKLLDAATLKELDRFPWNSRWVIPGDASILVRRDRKLYLRLPGQPDQQLSFDDADIWPDVRFINDTMLALMGDKTIAVASVDGTVMYRVPLRRSWYDSQVVTAASGSRFCLYEKGYTKLRTFFDLTEGRPISFESVRVLSVDSGTPLFELRWDPRPYVGYPNSPAISPNGTRLAVIRHGILEIFEVP